MYELYNAKNTFDIPNTSNIPDEMCQGSKLRSYVVRSNIEILSIYKEVHVLGDIDQKIKVEVIGERTSLMTQFFSDMDKVCFSVNASVELSGE